jgi:hypothetical protein
MGAPVDFGQSVHFPLAILLFRRIQKSNFTFGRKKKAARHLPIYLLPTKVTG